MIEILHLCLYVIGAGVYYVAVRLVALRARTKEYSKLYEVEYYYLWGERLRDDGDLMTSSHYFFLMLCMVIWPVSILLIAATHILKFIFRSMNELVDKMNSVLDKADKVISKLGEE